jgi:hypothetical protein
MTGIGMDCATRLIATSVVTALGTDVSIGGKAQIPEGDRVISILETGGPGHTEVQNRVGAYPNPSAQITARAMKASDAQALALAAIAALNVRNITINGVFYLWIRPVQSKPFDMGVDEKGRSKWAFNVNGRNS